MKIYGQFFCKMEHLYTKIDLCLICCDVILYLGRLDSNQNEVFPKTKWRVSSISCFNFVLVNGL